MSRLSDLIRDTKRQDPRLGAELESELRALSNQRRFGLVFEHHRPESVELPGREVRRGDLVRILPPRGAPAPGDTTKRGKKEIEPADPERHRHWNVTSVDTASGEAHLVEALATQEQPDERTTLLTELVVVSPFNEPIHPGLTETGSIERGGDKPAHLVINAENFHALRMLTYTHRHRVDVIYIDPPYNSRAKDWKYNNDYVDPEDDYNHSKWLAFMERRLLAAKDLLNPDDSVLIITIDEKEVHRLALLLEQTFPEAKIQMVTSIISAKGVVRKGEFSRVEEHIFFVAFGAATITPWESNMLPSYVEEDRDPNAGEEPSSELVGALEEDEEPPLEPIEWLLLRRREPSSLRGRRPNQFYPVFIDRTTGFIHSIGDAVDDDVDRLEVPVPEGTVAIWPLKPDGTEMLWGLTPNQLQENLAKGYVKVTSWNTAKMTGSVKYLPGGTIQRIENGQIVVTGKAEDGSVEGHLAPETSIGKLPKRVWHVKSHNAETGGTNLLAKILPKRHFPYPKSLYAVEDTLRFYVAHKPNAIILDFFAGSGTTAHATMRLNRQDDGRRQCISITNNEVSAAEQADLRAPDTKRDMPYDKGLRPGDPDWEKWGICDYITKPRLLSAITGKTPAGQPIKGPYRFIDAFPMSEGFEENARFFTLTYERPRDVEYGYGFSAVAPLLWMRAGSIGPIISDVTSEGWALNDRYGVLFDVDRAEKFLEAIRSAEEITTVFIVTDDQGPFQAIARRLPPEIETIRLYESYLSNFRIHHWEV